MLIDLRDVSAVKVASSFVSGYTCQFGQSLRRAIVCRLGVVYGMCRMYDLATDCGDNRVQITETVEEALH